MKIFTSNWIELNFEKKKLVMMKTSFVSPSLLVIGRLDNGSTPELYPRAALSGF